MKKSILVLALSVALVTQFCSKPESSTEQSAANQTAPRVFIESPQNGAKVSGTFTVKFGLENMEVAPAGTEKPNTGHHHLLVDFSELPDLTQPLGGNVKHFGGGQTSTELTLEPGEHTLQLIMADGNHVPHNPPVISEKITITVE